MVDEFEEKKKKAEGEIVRLNLHLNGLRDEQSRMKSLLRQEAVAAHLNEVYREIEKADGPRQRYIVQALIPKIIVHPNDLIEVRINAALESVTLEDEKYALIVNGGPRILNPNLFRPTSILL